jgi:hypothetical protein
MGVSAGSGMKDGQDLMFIGKMLNHIEFLISEVNLKTREGVEIKSYQDALENMEFMAILSEVAADILQAMEISPEKKN